MQTVQKTSEIPQVLFLDTVEAPVVHNNRCLGYDSAENCGNSAVAACRFFGPGRRHLCRGAETISHGLVQETIEILQLQYTDKVIVVPVVPVQFPSAGVEKTAELPHCSRRALDKVVGMPVCARQVPMTLQQGCGRPCDHAAGSAPYSVHRRCGGHSSSQQRQVSALGIMAAMF